MKRIISVLFAIFAFTMPAMACESNEIDTGSACVESKFELTTTNLSDDTEFKFKMSAAGVFYVDWGDGNVQTIDRTGNTTEIQYTHTYTKGGVKTIRFGGRATGYNGSAQSAIRFGHKAFTGQYVTDETETNTPHLIVFMSGSLSSIFPQKNKLSFKSLFAGATNLTNISPTLFSGLTGVGAYGFDSIFLNCTSLTSIPETLFRDIATINQGMFANTFQGCSNITSIPENLFKNAKGAANEAFYHTFLGCSKITSIPNNLFAGVAGKGARMFGGTFYNCRGLTSIPENLFSGVSDSASYMFAGTFHYCSNLSGYIPPSTFAGLTASDSPIAENMWSNTFGNTKLATVCPSGTTQYITDYEEYWDGRVSCYESTPQTCAAGEYLPQYYDSCAICPSGNACVGGTYSFNETTDQGIQSCANGTFAPSGSAVCYPHILHVGNSNVYLKSTKQTTPSLNIKIGNDVFYANMTTERTRMNKDSSRYLHIRLENNDYYVCDDTVCPQ